MVHSSLPPEILINHNKKHMSKSYKECKKLIKTRNARISHMDSVNNPLEKSNELYNFFEETANSPYQHQSVMNKIDSK